MIVGAGLSGMIAAFVFPKECILEERPESYVDHQAVLRFRSAAVSDLTGIPFRRVTVRKGIWWKGGWEGPSISLCNLYAMKTIGQLVDRSIWDITSVERYIAPADLHARLAELIGKRISWNTKADIEGAVIRRATVISTIPLPAILSTLHRSDVPAFTYAPIKTVRLELKNADVFQTVYFPSPFHSLYRASITGNLLICEFASDYYGTNELPGAIKDAASEVAAAFALPHLKEDLEAAAYDAHQQQYGKIAPIDEGVRRALVLELTQKWGIYSLGRFATWRNLLLDDVVHDAAVIKRMMTASSDYDRALGRTPKES